MESQEQPVVKSESTRDELGLEAFEKAEALLDSASRDFFSSQGIDLNHELNKPADSSVIGSIDLNEEERKKIPEDLIRFIESVYPDREVNLQRITLLSGKSRPHVVSLAGGVPLERTKQVILEVDSPRFASDQEKAKREAGFSGIVIPGQNLVRDNWAILDLIGVYPTFAPNIKTAEHKLGDWVALQDPSSEGRSNNRDYNLNPRVIEAVSEVVANPSIGTRKVSVK